MGLINKVKAMLGFKTTNCKASPVDPAISRAIQRNEMASVAAQQELEKLRMSDTLKAIAGRMK